MPIYAVSYRYRPDTEAARDELRPSHVEFLESLFTAGALRASGPTGDDATPGALLVVCADDAAQVASLIDDDPFNQAGLLDRTIREWRLFFGAERLVG
ncbi:MAG: hypothetical protein J0I43_08845 [Microbacterium sp.]|uniref:YciI family protein n=1 Tax=Microbacterium sp. TaxID=51671 RepID=UPI001AD4DAB1|nr:YciI family protein [Microbacterium sp.]MBN9177456.1 hypothetical protein [Microbacterium sp.]